MFEPRLTQQLKVLREQSEMREVLARLADEAKDPMPPASRAGDFGPAAISAPE
jgi:hypothetical protein